MRAPSPACASNRAIPVAVPVNRRRFLVSAAALGAAPWVKAADLLPPAKGRRVVIVGGGWGGLSAARHLRDAAPELEVVVVEPQPVFWSHALSNRWLAGLIDGKLLTHDRGAAARAFGYSLVQAEVTVIDRDRRRVHTDRGALAYDWLILATGIRHHSGAWFGDDRAAADHTRRHFPAAFTGRDETLALKAKLDSFKGGDLVMTVPPMPYRCPPAPYERAAMIGWLLKTRGVKGRLHVLDPNPITLGFDKIFRHDFADQISYLPNAAVKAVDPYGKTISTEFDTIPFDDAILLPPQQAGDLVWQAGLEARGGDGKPTGWAAQDPVHLHAVGDERVFLVGDLIDKASPLFGHYPKTGHLAARLGRIAALEIAARSRGREAPRELPEGVCYVIAKPEPREMMRVETHYRFRGDGEIQQTVKQTYDAQPRGEDEAWARGMFGEFLAFSG